jgi:catechol 2,3-dioxygenase-like lactoylglutathione lyase family enzyme
MQHTGAMIAFYRRLGFDVVEHKAVVSVHAGGQMINFHRPEIWTRDHFTLRAPAAAPPCGDLCFEWTAAPEELHARLAAMGVEIEEGPVARIGARRLQATSVYVRDPDGNLLEFLIYASETAS